jgi:RNA 2',3'-cyclic 3'-phosphodiesterase
MRLFVAVDLDDDVRREVGDVIARMRATMVDSRSGRISWVAPDHLHLTLHFLGNVDSATSARVAEAVAAPIEVPPFQIALEGLGTFPSRGRPNVMWLGVGRGREALIELQALVGSRLTSAGCLLETRPFSPHLTLARLKQTSGAIPKRGAKSALSPSLVDRVTLYESQLGRDGATHIKIAAGVLRPAGSSS